jgi:hypothetical protein
VDPDSSVGTATRYGLDGPGIESRWGRDFAHSSRPVLWTHSLLCIGYRAFPGGKAAGAWRWSPTPSSAEVKGTVELYLYSPSGPSWPVLKWALPLPLPLLYISRSNKSRNLCCLCRLHNPLQLTVIYWPTSCLSARWTSCNLLLCTFHCPLTVCFLDNQWEFSTYTCLLDGTGKPALMLDSPHWYLHRVIHYGQHNPYFPVTSLHIDSTWHVVLACGRKHSIRSRNGNLLQEKRCAVYSSLHSCLE